MHIHDISSKTSSLRSMDTQSEQISTGSVIAEQPVLRRAESTIPSIYVSHEMGSMSKTSMEADGASLQRLTPARVQSHHAKVNQWSESEQSDAGKVAWDRITSVASSASSQPRESQAASERSSCSRKTPSSIPEADETLHSPYQRSSSASARVDVNRSSDVSAVSSSSTLRRMEGLVNELDFGEAKR